MRKLCLRAIAIMAAVAMVVAGILPGISAVSAWAQETPEVTLTAVGLDGTHLVTSLVDVSNKTQAEINAAVESAVSDLTPIQVTLINTSETAYSAVRIAPVNAGSHIQLWAKDTNSNWYDINVVGWGPSEGFPLPSGYSATTEVYLLADTAGTYPLTVTLVDVNNNNATLVEVSGTVTVRNPSVYDFVFDASGLVAGRPKTVPVTLKAVEVKDDGYSNVRVDVAVTQKPTADATVSLKATDTNGQEFDVVQVGYWGPENGFPISNNYDVTTDFTALFSEPGDYTIELTLYDVAGQESIVSKSCSVTVAVPMKVSAQVPTFVVGQPAEFTVTTVANDDAGKLVRAYFTIPDGVSAEYYEDLDGKWYTLPNEYGPTDGFPVTDATSRFRATFDAAGTYTVGIDFKTVPDGEVLAHYDLHAEARAPQKSAYEFFLDSDGLVAGRPRVVPVTFAAVEVKDEGYSAVRFNVAVTQKPSPDAAVSLKATDSNGQEFDVVEVGYWGPEAGFPIDKDYSATTEFEALFSEPGTYCLTLSLYDVTNQTDIMTREFEVQVEPVAATFAPTGNIGSHDGKVYEEYQLKAGDQPIDLSTDNVQRITVLKPGASEPTALEPNTDSTLWFNVQNQAGDYVFTMVDKAGVTYTATLTWSGPMALTVTPTSAVVDYGQPINFNLSVSYPEALASVSDAWHVDGKIELADGKAFPVGATLKFGEATYTVPDGSVTTIWVSKAAGAAVRPCLNDDRSYEVPVVVTGLVPGTYTVNVSTVAAPGTDDATFAGDNALILATSTVEITVKNVSAIWSPTGKIGPHDGKVYEEYQLKAGEQVIDLSADKVQSITVLKPGEKEPAALEPNTDSTLWFNVQNPAGDYVFTVIDNNGITYTATLNWAGTTAATAEATGNSGESDGNWYAEYALKQGATQLDLSSFDVMYQIKPDGSVYALAANSDTTLWFKINDQVFGKHVFLVKQSGAWYEATIDWQGVQAGFVPTGNIGPHDGKVYEEYELKAGDQLIDLSADNVQRITVVKPDKTETALEPNTDSTLWFNVQNGPGDYVFTVVDKNGITYTATLSWCGATQAIAALAHVTYDDPDDGNRYIGYHLKVDSICLDRSEATAMYQIKPDGTVSELSNHSYDGNAILFRTTNQVAGQHTLLIKIGDSWYEANIVQTTWAIANLSTSGFTITVNPPVGGLSKTDLWIVLDATGFPAVQINSLTTTDGGATYAVSAPLQAGKSYQISITKDGYAFSSDYSYNIAKVTVPTPPSGGSGGSGGGGGTVTPAPQPVVSSTGSAAVNPAAGGKISLGEQVALQIPAGALSGTANVEVKIAKVDNPPAVPTGYKVVGQVYEFTVANQSHYTFSSPVTLTFTFDPSLLKPGERPAVHYYDETNSRWVNIGGTVSGNTITVTVDHFTRFAVLAAQAAPTVTLTDIAGHWAEADIVRLVNLGAVGGYPDGTFRPNDKITRAEFVNILVKALKLEARAGKNFADTKGHWAEGAISTAAAWGIVDGYDADHFGPNDPVTREQLVAMVVRALKLAPLSGQLAFSDAKAISAWAKDAVTTAVAAGIIGGYPDSTFRPTATATRAEAATILAKALR